MATVIKIKQSAGVTAPLANQLSQGELAYTFGTGAQSGGGSKLYIGSELASSDNLIIGGEYFTQMLDHTHGTLTADSAIIVDSDRKIDVLNVDNITLDGNTISITNGNGDLTLSANGTGKIKFTSNQEFAGNLDIGNTTTVQHLKVYGSAIVDNLKIDGNTINAEGGLFDQTANQSITITPKGAGDVALGTGGTGVLRIPAGPTTTRKIATSGTVSDTQAMTGSIRYNTSTHRFEGVVDGNWTGLGGVIDTDQDTYITAEEDNAGDSTGNPSHVTVDDTLRFFIANTEEMRLNSTELQVDVINGKAAQGSLGQVKVNTNLLVSGDLTVEGTTTTVESTVVTIADPVMHLGEGSLVLDDGLDRGVTFDYGNGTAVKTGFFGFDIQSSKFVFKPDTSVATAPAAVTVATSTRVPTLVDWTQRAYSGITEAQYNNGSGASIQIAAYTYTPEDFSAAWGDVAFGDMSLSGDASITGDTTVGGTLGVTGVTTLTGLLNANGGIQVNTDKFTVAALDGDVVTQGTLNVSGLSTLDGGIQVDTDNFTVSGTNGDVVTQGTLDVSGLSTLEGGIKVRTGTVYSESTIYVDHFTVDGANGDVVTAGTLNVAGASSFNTASSPAGAAFLANKVTIGTTPDLWSSGMTTYYSTGVIVRHVLAGVTKYFVYKAAGGWTMTATDAPGNTDPTLTAWEEINYKDPMVIDSAGRMTDGVITGDTIIDCGTF